MDDPRLRRATPADAPAVADVYLRSRRAAHPAIPHGVHSDDDVRRHFGTLVERHETWLCEDIGGEVVAVMVLAEGWIDQLYVAPECTGRGIGTRLVELAKERRPEGLQLWTFQSNSGARRFYDRQGFTAVELTDGSGNEEKAPDVRYVWP